MWRACPSPVPPLSLRQACSWEVPRDSSWRPGQSLGGGAGGEGRAACRLAPLEGPPRPRGPHPVFVQRGPLHPTLASFPLSADRKQLFSISGRGAGGLRRQSGAQSPGLRQRGYTLRGWLPGPFWPRPWGGSNPVCAGTPTVALSVPAHPRVLTELFPRRHVPGICELIQHEAWKGETAQATQLPTCGCQPSPPPPHPASVPGPACWGSGGRTEERGTGCE